ncbi:MAG: single-stranded-DNA-specific exonuclease RecJ [Anaerolineaceae bacterium]|nr:single-stranded-DNA-specific exonuclease RecJ [Anaerolineaceae bacterium]
MLLKHWIIASPLPPDIIQQYGSINPVLVQILHNRGLTTPQDAQRFLNGAYTPPSMLAGKQRMKGISEAVTRIRQAVQKHEPIVVYGDFDADGVTSTVLLVETLRSLNADVEPYIPHRVDEGYGVNSEALAKLAEAGKKLVITVDCGIRSVQEIEDGKATGLDMIVTDHHSIGPEIPNALAVINPKQIDCHYPEDMLAGVGVAYKLAEALLLVAGASTKGKQNGNPGLQVEDLLDLVAIGTVADLAPLNRLENRLLVQRGLKVINAGRRPGVRALLEVAGVELGTVNATTIGFALGPRINAAGRLDSALIAYDLLTATSKSEAEVLAQQLHELNIRRQELTREAQDTVREQIGETDGEVPLIFASDPSFQPGIVGLVAGRLAEEYFRPAVVMEEGETESRASCRSIPQFDITHALDQCADLLVRHGGHAQAAGFSVLNENIIQLREKLVQLAQETLEGQDLRPSLDVDVEVDIHNLSEDLLSELVRLEPTGHSNPTPVLMSRNLRVLECRTVGKEDRHLKLKLARAGQPPLDAIGFGLGEWAAQMPERIDAAYYLEINEWNGHRNLQLNLQDIRPSE